MTIGNLPKDIRRKPSRRGWILLAYLPVTRLEHLPSQAARRRATANLFHACLRDILEPLKDSAERGINLASGDGIIRRCHPILACYCGDYPEQVLIAGVSTGDCPKCTIPRHHLGSSDTPAELRDLDAILDILALIDVDYTRFTRACKEHRFKPIYKPFWQEHRHVNIFIALTPDVLHQLYQGVLKHLLAWIRIACGDAEIDARCRRLPPNHNIRIFMKGISKLSRVSGTEHNQICRFLLGILVDIPLPQGFNSARLLGAVRAILDFIYLAQYPCHTSTTLQLLDDALARFHENKQIFIDLGIRTHFNIPKIHSLRHYIHMIRLFGTTDNYTTEYTERLHIDLAKDAYRATNHKDEYYQMTQWLERQEKVQWHGNFVEWRRTTGQHPVEPERIPPDMDYLRVVKMAKHPSAKSASFSNLVRDYKATHFVAALSRFIVRGNQPQLTVTQLERAASTIFLPVWSVPVYHSIKYHAVNALGHEETSTTVDAIHCHPERRDRKGRVVPGRFDTALVNVDDGQKIGIRGECSMSLLLMHDTNNDIISFKGYRIAQVRVIFTLPEKIRSLFSPAAASELPLHFAYVEWFTPFASVPDRHHRLYQVKRAWINGDRLCSIVPVSDIRRSIHLIPRFGRIAPATWTSSNVLEQCDTFFVNAFTDRHAYMTIL